LRTEKGRLSLSSTIEGRLSVTTDKRKLRDYVAKVSVVEVVEDIGKINILTEELGKA
jgi:hypothetical protein